MQFRILDLLCLTLVVAVNLGAWRFSKPGFETMVASVQIYCLFIGAVIAVAYKDRMGANARILPYLLLGDSAILLVVLLILGVLQWS